MKWKQHDLRAFMGSLLILFTGIIVAGPLCAQTKPELVAIIRRDFLAINTDKALFKKTLSGEEFMENATDGGGELAGYYKNRSLVKIVEWIGLSYGNRTREFYFKNNKLFFVYEKFQSFVTDDSTGEMDHGNVNTTFEGRYYFNQDKLIGQKITGKRTFADESIGIAKELQEAAKENSKVLNK